MITQNLCKLDGYANLVTKNGTDITNQFMSR